MKKQNVQPTEAELEILSIIWELGPVTVRAVHERVAQKKDVGYTTTLKIMQNMTQKGMLQRDEAGRSHVYHPAVKQKETQNQLIDKILDTAFGGSAMQLVMQVLGNHKSSKKELKEIKKLIKKMEGGKS